MPAKEKDSKPAQRSSPLSSKLHSGFSERKSRLKTRGTGYSNYVRALKIAFPIAALIMTGIVITRLSEDPIRNVAEVPRKEESTPGQIELLSAQYEGVDAKGQPYTLIAARASRDQEDEKKVLLEALKADITLHDSAWIAVMADNGKYGTETEKLSLAGNVTVFYDSGYEMHMDEIDIDIKSRIAETTKPVRLQGTLGEINANGMQVIDEGTRIVFLGPVRMLLRNIGAQG